MSDKVLQVTWNQQISSCINNCSDECLLKRGDVREDGIPSKDILIQAWDYIRESDCESVGFYWNPGQYDSISDQIRSLIMKVRSYSETKNKRVLLATTLSCLYHDPILELLVEWLGIRVGINFYQAWLPYTKYPKAIQMALETMEDTHFKNIEKYVICALFSAEFYDACKDGIKKILDNGFDVHVAATGNSPEQVGQVLDLVKRYKSYLGNRLTVDCRTLAQAGLTSECPFDEIVLKEHELVHNVCVYEDKDCSLYHKGPYEL